MAVATNKGGRPEYEPNERDELVVRALCLFGANHVWISSYIGITAKTLRKHYPELLANCKADKNGAANSALFVQVIRGNMDAIKFWLEHNDPQYKKGGSGEQDLDKVEFLANIAKVLHAKPPAE